MKLSRYLKNNGLTHADFAKLVDSTEHAVAKWCRGERTPREKFMRKILSVTCGEVSPNDFFKPADVPASTPAVSA